jgi:hypothetical protein
MPKVTYQQEMVQTVPSTPADSVTYPLLHIYQTPPQCLAGGLVYVRDKPRCDFIWAAASGI